MLKNNKLIIILFIFSFIKITLNTLLAQEYGNIKFPCNCVPVIVYFKKGRKILIKINTVENKPFVQTNINTKKYFPIFNDTHLNGFEITNINKTDAGKYIVYYTHYISGINITNEFDLIIIQDVNKLLYIKDITLIPKIENNTIINFKTLKIFKYNLHTSIILSTIFFNMAQNEYTKVSSICFIIFFYLLLGSVKKYLFFKYIYPIAISEILLLINY